MPISMAKTLNATLKLKTLSAHLNGQNPKCPPYT